MRRRRCEIADDHFLNTEAQRATEKHREEEARCGLLVAAKRNASGVRDLWWKYVGLKGAVVGISRFGMSAPGNKVMEFLGINAKSVVDAARAL